MQINEKGLAIIKSCEGLRLTAYHDFAKGLLTIGYGHVENVKEGDTITQEEAEQYLASDCRRAGEYVLSLVRVPLTENQFSALVSFVFNLGAHRLKISTLRMKLNRGDYIGAADEFLRWNKAVVNSVLVPAAGLTKRRIEERILFLCSCRTC